VNAAFCQQGGAITLNRERHRTRHASLGDDAAGDAVWLQGKGEHSDRVGGRRTGGGCGRARGLAAACEYRCSNKRCDLFGPMSAYFAARALGADIPWRGDFVLVNILFFELVAFSW
jgi:hypothetical protein